jgi:hypothetical protein
LFTRGLRTQQLANVWHPLQLVGYCVKLVPVEMGSRKGIKGVSKVLEIGTHEGTEDTPFEEASAQTRVVLHGLSFLLHGIKVWAPGTWTLLNLLPRLVYFSKRFSTQYCHVQLTLCMTGDYIYI